MLKLIYATKCLNNHKHPQIHNQDSLHLTFTLAVLRGMALSYLKGGTDALESRHKEVSAHADFPGWLPDPLGAGSISSDSKIAGSVSPDPLVRAPSRPTPWSGDPSRPTPRSRALSRSTARPRNLSCPTPWTACSVSPDPKATGSVSPDENPYRRQPLQVQAYGPGSKL